MDDVPEEPAGIIATRGRKARIFLTFSRLLWQIAAADEGLRLTPGIGDSSLAHEPREMVGAVTGFLGGAGEAQPFVVAARDRGGKLVGAEVEDTRLRVGACRRCWAASARPKSFVKRSSPDRFLILSTKPQQVPPDSSDSWASQNLIPACGISRYSRGLSHFISLRINIQDE